MKNVDKEGTLWEGASMHRRFHFDMTMVVHFSPNWGPCTEPMGLVLHFLLPIHDFRENGSTCITLRQSVSLSVRQSVSPSVTLLLAR